jgi:hypothetical protein
MRRVILCALACALWGGVVAAQSVETKIVALERSAMEGWLQGNPDAFLKLADPDITYFHSTQPDRLVGLQAVKALCETYRGRPLFDRYEIGEPRVAVSGGTAVLTYVLTTRNGDVVRRWHATVVYRDGAAGWKTIHAHFSQAAP